MISRDEFKRFARIAAIALGWTTLDLASLIERLVASRTNLSVYHWAGPISTLFGPVLTFFVAVWAALTLLLLSARSPGRWRVAVWSGLIVSTPWIAVNALNALLGESPVPHVRLPPFSLFLVACALLVCFWRPAFARRFEQATRFMSVMLGFVGVMGAIWLMQSGWYWWSGRSLNEYAATSPSGPATPQGAVSGNRIIWVVLDELSYDQVFEHRFTGLNLPAFDALAAQATSLTHVVPAGNKTDRVFPALISGKPVQDVEASSNGGLYVRRVAEGRWVPFNQHDSVFQDALNAGYRTAAVGWYNPYCRILPEVLDRCYWSDDGLTGAATTPGGAFEANLLQTISGVVGKGRLRRLVTSVVHLPPPNATALYHVRDFRNLSAAGDQILADRTADFVLLHLPVPHPEGIFDRRTGQLTTGPSSYIDNLALADRCLARIRADLEAAGQWDSSTVIVMGDHSWRTSLIWAKSDSWTPEEDRASSGGKFDDRPAYLVKLPGQHTGARLDNAFSAEQTRALMDAVMTRKIKTADDLAFWVEHVAQPPQPHSQTAPRHMYLAGLFP